MYRVLIVDDEAIIADGLQEELQLNSRAELDVYKAYSGRSALELLARHRIDVVVTDIRMPGMDGMALLENIRAGWPECRVIFLTGHREFDYVYKAIQVKGLQYVLKTEGYARVIAAVEQAVGDIEAEMKRNDQLGDMRRRMDAAAMFMQRDLLRNLLDGACGRYLERDFAECGVGLLAGGSVMLVAGRLSPPAEPCGFSDAMHAHQTVKFASERYLSQNLRLAFMPDETCDAVLFVQPAKLAGGETAAECEAAWEGARLFLQGTLELIQASVKTTLGRTISFCLPDAPSAWADVPDAYAAIRRMMDCRIGPGEEMLLTAGAEGCEASGGAAREPAGRIRQKVDALSSLLDRGEREEYMKAFDGLAAGFADPPGRPGGPAQEAYYSVALMLLPHLNRWQTQEKLPGADAGLLMRPDRFRSWEQAAVYLRQLSQRIFELQHADQDRRANDILTRVKTYVDAHLGDDLSLLKLSDIMFFNPSYLSRLFKQLSGENLTGYIQAKRLEKARSMLGRNEIRINDIALAVGFGSATNFTRFFKKETGMTPAEYRDRLSDSKAGITM